MEKTGFDPWEFVHKKVEEIRLQAGGGVAISALSGGIDSTVVTLLGHKALGNRIKAYFIDSGLMRQDEPQKVILLFEKLGVKVERINAQQDFFKALKGLTDPEEKREAVAQTFYKKVFGDLMKKDGAEILLQGTILTDIDETVAGIKRQHNVFEQIGISPQKEFGYQIIEPLVQLRKDGVREVAAALNLPKWVCNRIPFPGPGLAVRIIGEATPERIETVRIATAIVETALKFTDAFQYLAVLHEDRVTGIKNGERVYGQQIEVRCWDSVDARTAKPTKLLPAIKQALIKFILNDVPDVVSVTFNETPKPPSTIEAM